MKFREAIEQTAGLRRMAEGLGLVSAPARRVLYEERMMVAEEEIEREISLVERAVAMFADARQADALGSIELKLREVKELRGTLARLTARRTLDDVELFELKLFAMTSEAIRGVVSETEIDLVEVPDVSAVVALLDPDGTRIPHFSIYDAYSAELAAVRRGIKEAKRGGVPEERLAELHAENTRLEDDVRARLTAGLHAHVPVLEAAAAAISRLDILMAKARQAIDFRLCKPEVSYALRVTGDELATRNEVQNDARNKVVTSYKGLFNPVVREVLRGRGKDFQPVDIALDRAPTLITGANMGGKTVLLKSIALAQTMFQFGFYVAATEAIIAPVDEVLTSIGDAQDELSGLSSFAAEMMRLDRIIGRVQGGRRALVLVDEPARTTNPVEGEAIVNALVELLAAHRVPSLVTSHYGGIRADARRLRVKGFAGNVDDAQTKITAANIGEYMDYSLIPDDGHTPREALRIARILGVDEELTARAAYRMKSEE
jgi:dsDNA-specific endonuclease/ATPase MutS2